MVNMSNNRKISNFLLHQMPFLVKLYHTEYQKGEGGKKLKVKSVKLKVKSEKLKVKSEKLKV
jgi:hypothetical protein